MCAFLFFINALFYLCAYNVAIYEAKQFYALTIYNGIVATAAVAVSSPQTHTQSTSIIDAVQCMLQLH